VRISASRIIWPAVVAAMLVLSMLFMAIGIALIQLGGRAQLAGGHTLQQGGQPTVFSVPTATGIDPYRGLGAWVDIFDGPAWRNPAATVADMESHGVRTLFIETATARSSVPIVNPTGLATFITEAHAHHMYVVAWYPPSMRSDAVDYQRVLAAIDFTTLGGQKCDSVALDIESTAVKPLAKRNQALAMLSQQVRSHVGAGYPLGGIIPSPVGLTKQTGFWNAFPYSTVAHYYDVLLPMAYYTFHGHGAGAAYADGIANMRLLRSKPGCAKVPVHLIGGLAGDSTAAETGQFVRAARDSGCIGASLYDWIGTSRSEWTRLAGVPNGSGAP
jgi:hypothetical protein